MALLSKCCVSILTLNQCCTILAIDHPCTSDSSSNVCLLSHQVDSQTNSRLTLILLFLLLLLLLFFLLLLLRLLRSLCPTAMILMCACVCVAMMCVQYCAEDLNRDHVSSVRRAGPQPRSCEFSVTCRASTAIT